MPLGRNRLLPSNSTVTLLSFTAWPTTVLLRLTRVPVSSDQIGTVNINNPNMGSIASNSDVEKVAPINKHNVAMSMKYAGRLMLRLSKKYHPSEQMLKAINMSHCI